MGMGLLGAMGGLGQAGQQIGNTMMQHALKEEEITWLTDRQNKMAEMHEARKKAAIDTERKETGLLYDKATSGAGIAEGPPTEDGAMPKGPMSDKEKMSAYSDALGKAGRHAEKMQVDTLMQRDEATTAMRELKDRLNQRTNDTRLTTTGMRVDGQLAGKSATLASILARRGAGGAAGSSASGNSNNADLSKIVDGITKKYGGVFDANKDTNSPADLDGMNAFERLVEIGLQASPSARHGDVALEALNRIEAARKSATDANGAIDRQKYLAALKGIHAYKTRGEVIGDEAPPNLVELELAGKSVTENNKADAPPKPERAISGGGLLGLSVGSKPTEDIYADAGPDNARLGALPGVPFAKLLDILRGKNNHEALGKRFESSEDSLLDWISRGEKQ